MAAATHFSMQAGEPFERTIRVPLPEPYRSYWTDEGDFEVLSQVRRSRSQTAELMVDLAQFFTVTYADDEITIVWSMTGADTRLLEGKGGEYDMLVTDAGTTDARGLPPILWGKVKVKPVVTAAAEEVEGP